MNRELLATLRLSGLKERLMSLTLTPLIRNLTVEDSGERAS
jgi:hypothetical protein